MIVAAARWKKTTIFVKCARAELESGVKDGAFGQMSVVHQQLTTVEAKLPVSFGSNNEGRRPELFNVFLPLYNRYDIRNRWQITF